MESKRIAVQFISLSMTLLVLALSQKAVMAEGMIPCRVKHVSSDRVFLDHGRADGLQPGDTVYVSLENHQLPLLTVLFVADHSSACRFLGDPVQLQVNDPVFVRVHFTLPESKPVIPEESPGFVSDQRRIEKEGTSVRSNRRREKSAIRGRIGTQVRYQDNQSGESDYAQPALSIGLTFGNLFGSDLDLVVRGRLRQSIYYKGSSPDRTSRYNRLYEVALVHEGPGSPFSYRLGRITSSRVSGMGTMDGLFAEYTLSPRLKVGVFGGVQPDYRTSEIKTDESRFGGFIYHEHGSDALSTTMTLALVGNYFQGEIDREFLYEQSSFRFGRRLMVYQSGELSINRGWRHDLAGSTLTLSNFVLSTSYRLTTRMRFTMQYDNRTRVRRFINRDTPDSLFDDATRQGFRVGIEARPAGKWLISVQRGVRDGGNSGTGYNSFNVTLGKNDLFLENFRLLLTFRSFDSPYARGIQPSIRAGKSIWRFNTALELGQNRYSFKSDDSSLRTSWLRVSLDAPLWKKVYSGMAAELTRGGGYDSNHFFLETGVRF